MFQEWCMISPPNLLLPWSGSKIMQEIEFKINQYIWLDKTCTFCGGLYKVRSGGQKSGMSPAVHVDTYLDQNERVRTGEVQGFCSSQCLTEYLGEDITQTLAYRAIASWGIDPMIWLGRKTK